MQDCDNNTAIPISIDTEGLHPATESCLEALQWLHEHYVFANALDIGCGNGILSLATASIWDAKVLATDIAQQAIDDTIKNISDYHMENAVTPLRSDGFSHAMIGKRAPYDLILFNLLAEPIVRMAPAVRSHLADNGICVLSGILSWLAGDVEATYAKLGFTILKVITRSPWQTYILAKNPV